MTSVALAKPDATAAASVAALDGAFERLFVLESAETTELILARHAEPDRHAALRSSEPSGPPLSERGRCQAMRLAMRLRGVEIDAIYTSSVRAALETAAVVAAAKDMPMVRAPQLRQIAFSAASLNGDAGDPQKLAAEMAIRFLNRPRWDSLRGFEPSREFRHRVIQAIEGIVAHHPGKRVLVVTHESAINAYLSMILDIGRDMFFLPEHTSLSTIRVRRDIYGVQGLNDFAHLQPAFNPR